VTKRKKILITTTVAAKMLEVNRATIVRWVDSGHLQPEMKLPGQHGTYLFPADQIDAIRRRLGVES
jgi:excisionase family DNA binding protein